MKRTIIAAMVASLAVGSLALADPPQGYDHDHDQQQDRHHDEHDRDMHHDRDEHHDRGEHRGHADFNRGRYLRPHGYYVHEWRRGERLPPAYREQTYLIPDYATYRLRPPPRGYYWVRVDDNAVLAAVATGVVVDVAVNLFH